ncbi:MAG: pectate lyase family protein [Myxococcota bacterium]
MTRSPHASLLAGFCLLLALGSVSCSDVTAQAIVSLAAGRGGGGGELPGNGGTLGSGGSVGGGEAGVGNAGSNQGGSPGQGGAGGGGAATSGGSAGTAGILNCPSNVVGWAATGPGTSGGDGGKVVRATTASELKTYATDAAPLIVEIDRTIVLTEQIRPKSNKTFIGVGSAGALAGGGLYLIDAENVIIRNLAFMKPERGDDAITIQSSRYVWVDHCDLWTSLTEKPLDFEYDGLIDINHGSDFVTLSWNHFHDHENVSVIGHSNSASAIAEDTGHLSVTLHHNFFREVAYDTPRVRFGKVHIFNNYFLNISSNAIISQMGADVYVENNAFANVALPLVTHYVETGADGNAAWIENQIMNSGDPMIGTMTTWQPATAYSYQASLDSSGSVPFVVPQCAGVGKL